MVGKKKRWLIDKVIPEAVIEKDRETLARRTREIRDKRESVLVKTKIDKLMREARDEHNKIMSHDTELTRLMNTRVGVLPDASASHGSKEYVYSPLFQFDNAIAKINDERGNVYGHPAVNFARATHMHKAVNQCNDEAMRHALQLITNKIARLIESPRHIDSWIDIAGYARTAVMVIQREEDFPDHPPGHPSRPDPVEKDESD